MQQRVQVARPGAGIKQALAKLGDAHRGVGSGNQCGLENNYWETVRILTQAWPRCMARG